MCIPPIHCERDENGDLIGNVKVTPADGSLTFTEFSPILAAGLTEPWEVYAGGEWSMLVMSANLAFLLEPSRRFRRSRPKRSRVQEMADEFRAKAPGQWENSIERVVRAVCEYLRTERIACGAAAVGPNGYESAPTAIEREFLEPRS